MQRCTALVGVMHTTVITQAGTKRAIVESDESVTLVQVAAIRYGAALVVSIVVPRLAKCSPSRVLLSCLELVPIALLGTRSGKVVRGS